MSGKVLLPVFIIASILSNSILASGVGQIQLIETAGVNPYDSLTVNPGNVTVVGYLVTVNGTAGPTLPFTVDPQPLTQNGITIVFNTTANVPPYTGSAAIFVSSNTPVGLYNITFGTVGADPTNQNTTTTFNLLVLNQSLSGPMIINTSIESINSSSTTTVEPFVNITTILIQNFSSNSSVPTINTTNATENGTVTNNTQQQSPYWIVVIIIVIVAAIAGYLFYRRSGNQKAINSRAR
ncbi:MAG: hypothetical protein KGH72_01220 [Candidatus Micrarchaeota archaeon]|nr:hypothetical protein [Candidatus Micrarchaeota archaeon]